MKNRVIAKAKRGEETKVSITFQSKQSLKEQFEQECKKESISMTSALNALMETFLEDQGVEYSNNSIVELIKLQDKVQEDVDWYKENFHKLTSDQLSEMSMKEASLLAIHRELQKKGMK
ncbi:MAG: hypothetical protein PHS42_04275 [Sulfurimonas sp.]|nr:hypothetical protein [Sulfurimonas sp.]MDD3834671.1 hypothetical protein [Sulfurimonas sp.]